MAIVKDMFRAVKNIVIKNTKKNTAKTIAATNPGSIDFPFLSEHDA